MKILTKGEIPKKPLPEWVGMILTCSFCNTIFELDENDHPNIISERGRMFKLRLNTISVHCPFCMAHVSAKYEIKKSF